MKKAKTIKLLADGSVAKVGRIVVIGTNSGGNRIGSIRKITALCATEKGERSIFCDAEEYRGHHGKDYKNMGYYEEPSTARPATKEERQQYYASLTN